MGYQIKNIFLLAQLGLNEGYNISKGGFKKAQGTNNMPRCVTHSNQSIKRTKASSRELAKLWNLSWQENLCVWAQILAALPDYRVVNVWEISSTFLITITYEKQSMKGVTNSWIMMLTKLTYNTFKQNHSDSAQVFK